MGFLKDIEDMPNQFEYSKTFFDRWYRPEYTTVIVAGDVTPDEVFPLVEKYWGVVEARARYKVDIPQEPAPKGPVVAHVPWAAPTLPWVTRRVPRRRLQETSREWAALDVLSDLTFGPTSALYKRLVEEEQKVDQLGSFFPPNSDPYLITIYARVKKAEDAPYVRDRDPEGARPGAGRAVAGPARRGREGQQRATGCCARSTTPSRSRRRSRASCATAGRSTRSTSSTAPTTR